MHERMPMDRQCSEEYLVDILIFTGIGAPVHLNTPDIPLS